MKKRFEKNLAVAVVILCLCLCGFTIYYDGINMLFLSAAIVATALMGVFILKKKEFGRVLSFISFLVIPVAAFYGVEYLTHNPFEMKINIQILNICLFYAFYVFFFVLFKRQKIAFKIANTFILIVGLANYYTILFRSSPILPWDLLSAKTALSVSNNYEFKFTYSMLFIVMLFVGLNVISDKCRFRIQSDSWNVDDEKFTLKEKLCDKAFWRVKLQKRLIPIVSIVVIISSIAVLVQNDEFKEKLSLNKTLFTQKTLYKNNGFYVAFLMNLKYLNIKQPDGYSVAAVENILDDIEGTKTSAQGDGQLLAAGSEKVQTVTGENSVQVQNAQAAVVPTEAAETLAADDTQQSLNSVETNADDTDYANESEDSADKFDLNWVNKRQKSSENPNIIVVMNESFSDLGVLGDFKTNQDYMPFIHAIYDNTIKGNLFVSVLAGNTANSEYEFLTGDSMAFLPAGSVPYQQYINKSMPTLVSALNSLGYRTIGMHPYNASGWDRDEVYEYFGFNEIYFAPNFKNPTRIRKYISDETTFEKIIELYEEKPKNEKLFVFDVTMQNHSGYSQEYENFSPSISLEGITGKGTVNYLSLVKVTDDAFEKLINYFSKADEDTIILMFGDHQPSDYVANPIIKANGGSDDWTLEQQQNRYIVPFVLWANYDIPEQQIDKISLNYLSGILMQTAGLELTPYQKYLTKLREDYPVITANIYIDKDGNMNQITDDVIKDKLNDYSILQYNHLFDSSHRVEKLFSLDYLN